MTHLTLKDLAFAGIPSLASITLSQINSVIGIVGGLIGIAYLVWKWSREAKRD